MSILKDVWGEIIKKIGAIIVLAVALFAVPVMAQNIIAGNGGVDILAQGIFETEGSAITIPAADNANIDGVIVGNDRALAFGPAWINKASLANANNNLEIKKNQQHSDGILLVNLEQIKVGNREALAFGSATASNNVKIVTNQMGAPIEAETGFSA